MDHLAEVEKLIANSELIDPELMAEIERVRPMCSDPKAIREYWISQCDAPTSLFKSSVGFNGGGPFKRHCPTEVRLVTRPDFDMPDLAAALKGDERIPKSPDAITPESLIYFAAWQQHIRNVSNA